MAVRAALPRPSPGRGSGCPRPGASQTHPVGTGCREARGVAGAGGLVILEGSPRKGQEEGPVVVQSWWRSPVERFRVIALVTGTMLLLLVLVGMPLRYWAHQPAVDGIVGLLHGVFLVPLYLLATLNLAWVARWSVLRTVLVACGILVPGAAFIAERKVVREERARLVQPDALV